MEMLCFSFHNFLKFSVALHFEGNNLSGELKDKVIQPFTSYVRVMMVNATHVVCKILTFVLTYFPFR